MGEFMTPLVAIVPYCPKCGDTLRLRDGRNGEFWGCQSYPDCRYTCPYDSAVVAAYRKGMEEGQRNGGKTTRVDAGSMDMMGLLRRVVVACHPDKHGGAQWANDLTAEVNAVVTRIKKRAS